MSETSYKKKVAKVATLVAEVEAEAKPIVEDPKDFIEVHGTSVDLMENSVRVHLSNGTTRIISYADFSSTLLTFMDKAQETNVSTSRYLPRNVYVIEEGAGHLNLGFYFPESVQNIDFLGTVRKSVVPNIILNVFLTRGIGSNRNNFKYSQSKYYCTNLPLSRLPKELVRGVGPNVSILPFTNVYQEGDLCMGGNAILQEFPNNDLRPTIWFHDLLWASQFNTDLGLRALKGSSDYKNNCESWYKLLANLAKEGKGFPYEHLNHM